MLRTLARPATLKLGDERIERPATFSLRRVLGADARQAATIETGSAYPVELAIAPALDTIRVTTAAEGTLRHRPVMVAAFVQAVSAIGHRGDWLG